MQVDRVGWATAICYGFFIPCFLGFLFAKQNVVMRKVKTVVMQTAGNEAKVTVRLQGPKSEESEKDLMESAVSWAKRAKAEKYHQMDSESYQKYPKMMLCVQVFLVIKKGFTSHLKIWCRMAQHLKAAAAAYVAVHVKGRATVELQKDATMLGQRVDFSCRVDAKSWDSNQSAGGFSWLVFLRKVFLTCLFLLPIRGSQV